MCLQGTHALSRTRIPQLDDAIRQPEGQDVAVTAVAVDAAVAVYAALVLPSDGRVVEEPVLGLVLLWDLAQGGDGRGAVVPDVDLWKGAVF